MNKPRLIIAIDTSPLAGLSAVRGIGTYTRQLAQHLESLPDVKIVRPAEKNQQLKPDLIHYPYFDLFFSTLPIVRKSPTVVTIHDLIPLKFPNNYLPGVRGSLNFIRQKLALKTVQAVITDSYASKIDIHELLGVPWKKISVVYLGVTANFKPASTYKINQVRRAQQIPPNYLIYVGDINYNKNLPQLIKSLKYLPDNLHLVLVGKQFSPQPIKEWQVIASQVALSNVSHRVHFINHIPVGDLETIPSLISGAVAYIQPSIYEGFGLTIVEAMSCLTPVVVGRNSSQIEIVAKYGQMVMEDAESLAIGIQTVINWSKVQRQKNTKAALKWVNKFNWQETALETLRIYREVLER